ncbi:hypothetical protein BDN72DRAFT_212483 [Pluteus cervinus]|uniref:Uncharacterized protein n=1 Tax=Pluteus cervinus TaxID=181527 RepID=A0ACD3B6F0_9AGAR|nr:hypothetical protein BDN72DRAFT_212483 [Pluteus cervinus]
MSVRRNLGNSVCVSLGIEFRTVIKSSHFSFIFHLSESLVSRRFFFLIISISRCPSIAFLIILFDHFHSLTDTLNVQRCIGNDTHSTVFTSTCFLSPCYTIVHLLFSVSNTSTKSNPHCIKAIDKPLLS